VEGVTSGGIQGLPATGQGQTVGSTNLITLVTKPLALTGNSVKTYLDARL
jgi:hypothetical protein